MQPRKICYFAGAAGNWGGASRVLFTNLRKLDRTRFSPIVLLSGHGPAEALLQALDIPCVVWGPLTEPAGVWASARLPARYGRQPDPQAAPGRA